MIAKIMAVNAVAILLLAAMSYAVSALMLEGLAALDKWLDPSRKRGSGPLESPNQPPEPMPLKRHGSS